MCVSMCLCSHFPTDRDECLISHYCMHRCVNTVGSYYCECDIGYKLSNNNHSCVGECSGLSSCVQLQPLNILLRVWHGMLSVCVCLPVCGYVSTIVCVCVQYVCVCVCLSSLIWAAADIWGFIHSFIH